jgi:phospholipid/cholesterol/gamma-HCH transport system ATP-binding protein
LLSRRQANLPAGDSLCDPTVPSLARALALDPELLFLDEPTSGLDPIGAVEFDELIASLQRTLGLMVFMVTQDLDSLYSICDRIIALADRKVIASGPISAMLASEHPWLRAYSHGKRARRNPPWPCSRAKPPSLVSRSDQLIPNF